MRGALTTPFQPYLLRGGMFSVALSRCRHLWSLAIIVSLPSSDFPQAFTRNQLVNSKSIRVRDDFIVKRAGIIMLTYDNIFIK